MAEQDKNVNQTPAQGKTDKPAKKKDAQPNAVVRFFRRIGKWLRDLRSAIRISIWPTGKQVFNNTVVVIVCIIVIGIFVALLDAAFGSVRSLIVDLV